MLEVMKMLLRDVLQRHAPSGEEKQVADAGPAPADSWPPREEWYQQDGLYSVHNHEFMQDPAFVRAYSRGLQAVGVDYRWHWRVHVGLWAAACAARLEGDFVECGVNYGFLSSSIMTLLDWDRRGKTFYLLDTFAGMDERYVSQDEIRRGTMALNAKYLVTGHYVRGADRARHNFSEWRNVRIIVGPVPETLPQVDARRIAFMHLDMNCAPPEVAAAEYFWPRMEPGALLLLDDYAFHGYRPQKLAMDEFARSKGVPVLSLPTGQGLIIKPPA